MVFKYPHMWPVPMLMFSFVYISVPMSKGTGMQICL